MRRTQRLKRGLPILAFAAFAAGPVLAQEAPFSLIGTVGTGFFRHETNTLSLNSSPVDLRLRAGGYLGHPDFFSYYANPTLTFGRQYTQFGFRGSNGITTGFSFLRRRAFPLRFRFSSTNSPRQFNPSSSQLGKFFGTRQTQWDISSDVRLPGFRPLQLKYRTDDTRYTLSDDTPEFRQQGDEMSASLGKDYRGWQWRGGLNRNLRQRDTFLLQAGQFQPYTFQIDRRTARSSLITPSFKGTDVNVSWYKTGISNEFSTRRFDLENDSLSVEVNSRWGDRLRTRFRADDKGNVNERFLVPDPSQPGVGALGLTESNLRAYTGNATYEVASNVAVVGSVGRFSSDVNLLFPSQTASFTSSGRTGSVGVDVTRPIPSGSVRANYRYFSNRFHAGSVNAPLTPFTDRADGHSFGAAVSLQDVLSLRRFSGQFTYSLEDPGGSLLPDARRLGFQIQGERYAGKVLRVHGTFTYGKSSSSQILTPEGTSRSFSLSLTNHLFQFTYYHNDSRQSSLFPASGGPSPGSLISRTSDTAGDSFTGRFHLWESIPINIQWLRNALSLDGTEISRFRFFYASTFYRLGFLTLESGIRLTKSSSGLFSSVSTLRNDVFFRVERRFVIF